MDGGPTHFHCINAEGSSHACQIPGNETKEVFETLMTTFPEEIKHKKDKNLALQDLIFSPAVHNVDEADPEKREARYTSTRELLAGWIRQQETIKSSQAQAAMNIWLDSLAESFQKK